MHMIKQAYYEIHTEIPSFFKVKKSYNKYIVIEREEARMFYELLLKSPCDNSYITSIAHLNWVILSIKLKIK
jgi:hypothetical protein